MLFNCFLFVLVWECVVCMCSMGGCCFLFVLGYVFYLIQVCVVVVMVFEWVDGIVEIVDVGLGDFVVCMFDGEMYVFWNVLGVVFEVEVGVLVVLYMCYVVFVVGCMQFNVVVF